MSKTVNFKFDLGEKVRCIVTGFEGIVVSRTDYLNRCKRYGVQDSKLQDGQVRDWEYFDEEQLEYFGEGIIHKVKNIFQNKQQTGGPRQEAPMR